MRTEELTALAHAVRVASEDFGDALMKRVPVVALKSCDRCDGHGFATMFSKTRAHWTGNGKKVCFKCGGSGTVAATRKDQAVLKAAHARNDLERLRARYLGHVMAVSCLEAAVAAGGDWSVQWSLKTERDRMARIVVAGKAAAAVVAEG